MPSRGDDDVDVYLEAGVDDCSPKSNSSLGSTEEEQSPKSKSRTTICTKSWRLRYLMAGFSVVSIVLLCAGVWRFVLSENAGTDTTNSNGQDWEDAAMQGDLAAGGDVGKSAGELQLVEGMGLPNATLKAADYTYQPYCRDTPLWANGFNCLDEGRTAEDGCTELGWTCAGYEKNKFCKDGKVVGPWAMGKGLHSPEHNCCECGGSADQAHNCAKLGCGVPYNRDYQCQCNADCTKYGNCCWDYTTKCNSGLVKSSYVTRYPALLKPSTARTYQFYVYRAQTTESFSPALSNVNAASLGGVMWYLHNEIVYKCPRRGTIFSKADIVRILRYKVTYKPTQPLWDRGMSFGVFCAYDYAACTGPGNRHGEDWSRYGYYVGCEYLGNYPHTQFGSGKAYPEAIWYSFPGYCPNEDFPHKTEQCAAQEPGGYTGGKQDGGPTPTGAGDSTYTFEPAGEISIDELVGIGTPGSRWSSHDEFCRSGCKEYVPDRDRGSCGFKFWDWKWDASKNKDRVRQADDLFFRRYPHMSRDRDMPAPTCDFNIENFYRNHMPTPPR